MKKWLSFLLIITFLLPCLASCNVNGDPLISIKMSTINPWINNEADKVVKVEEIHTYYGIAPNIKMGSYYTEDTEIIKEYMKWLGSASLAPVIPVTGTGGGGSTKRVFTFADGSTKEISISHGMYLKFLCFEVDNQKFLDQDSMNLFYRFNVSNKGYSIYICGDNATPVKQSEDGADDLGFIRVLGEVEPENEATHYLVASFGTVYIYSDTLCYIDAGEEDVYENNGYYELYGTTFSELMK